MVILLKCLPFSGAQSEGKVLISKGHKSRLIEQRYTISLSVSRVKRETERHTQRREQRERLREIQRDTQEG